MISMDDSTIESHLKSLFDEQNLAVVATDMLGLPYTSLVAFVADPDLHYMLFATFRNTRKFENIKRNSRVTLLVDNRQNKTADFSTSIAVTIEGKANIIDHEDNSFAILQEQYAQKHAYLKDFLMSPNCALIRVDVEKYHLVSNFQNMQILVRKP